MICSNQNQLICLPCTGGHQPGIINLCESKFYTTEFVIDKSYAKILQQKREIFNERVKPGKTLFLTMITTFGVKENDYFDEHIQQNLTMEELF